MKDTLAKDKIKVRDIIAVFDLDSSTHSFITRDFLRKCEKKKMLVSLSKDIPRSVIITSNTVYLSGISSKTLLSRLDTDVIFELMA